jgi:hypothetical protein
MEETHRCDIAITAPPRSDSIASALDKDPRRARGAPPRALLAVSQNGQGHPAATVEELAARRAAQRGEAVYTTITHRRSVLQIECHSTARGPRRLLEPAGSDIRPPTDLVTPRRPCSALPVRVPASAVLDLNRQNTFTLRSSPAGYQRGAARVDIVEHSRSALQLFRSKNRRHRGCTRAPVLQGTRDRPICGALARYA